MIVFATLGSIRSWMLYCLIGKRREKQNKAQVESKHSPLSAGTRLRKAADRTQSGPSSRRAGFFLHSQQGAEVSLSTVYQVVKYGCVCV